MNKLVKLKNNIPVADSRAISEEFGQEHRNTLVLIDGHKNQLERFGTLSFQTIKPKIGRPSRVFFLTEKQCLMLLTYTRSRIKTDNLRVKLINEFTAMRETLLRIANNKQNEEWLSCRTKGKEIRNSATAVVKDFVEYAKNQGSKSAEMYHVNISKMENKALFFVTEKYPNLRDVMDKRQLSFIQSADTITREALIEGMDSELFYKDIYKLAKKRIEALSELIPITSIPMRVKIIL